MHDQPSNSDRPKGPPHKGGGRGLVKILLRVLTYGSILFLLILGGAVLLLQNDSVQQKIKGFAVQSVEKQLHAKLEVGRIGGNLLYNLSLEDVRLEGEDGLIFKADRVSASYLGPMLLKKILFIQTLRIEGLLLNLREGPDGRWNITSLMPGDKEQPSTFGFVLKRVSLSDSAAVITTLHAGKEEVRRIHDINAVADLREVVDPLSGKGIALEFRQGTFRVDRPEVTVDSLTGRVVYDPADKRIRLSDLRVKTEASDLTLSGGLDFDTHGVDLNTHLRPLSLREAGRILSLEEPLRGTVTGSLELKGSPDHLFHRLELRSGKLSLASRGYLNLTGDQGPGVDLSGSIRNLNPADLPIEKRSLPAGDINTDLSVVAHNLSSPSQGIEARFVLKPSRLSGHEIKKGNIALRLDSRGLTLDEGHLTGPSGHVDLQGSLSGVLTSKGPRMLKLNATLRDFDLKALAFEKIAGKANLNLQAEATVPALSAAGLKPQESSARVLADIKPSIFNGIDIRGGLLEAAWTKGRLDLKKVELSSKPADITLSGAVNPYKQKGSLTAKIGLPNLSALPPFLSLWLPPTGQDAGLSGSLKMSGELDGWWNRLAATASLKGRNVTYKGFSTSRLKLSGHWRGPINAFDSSLSLDLKGLNLEGNRFSEAKAKVRLLPAKAAMELTARHEGGGAGKLRGEVRNWSGPVKDVTVDLLQFTAKRDSPLGRMTDRIVNAGPIRLRVSRDVLDISCLTLSSGKARLSLEGRIARGGKQDLKLLAEDMPLEPFASMLTSGEKITGSLSAAATLSGTAEKPLIDGRINVGEAAGFGLSFSKLNADVRYDGSTAYLKADLYRQEKRILDVDGRAGLTLSILPFALAPQPNSLAVNLTTSELSISELPLPRIRGMDLSGNINVKATALGNITTPILKGSLSMKDGSLSLKDPAVSYKIVGLNIAFTKTAVEINEIRIEDQEGGKLRLTGRIGLNGLRPADFHIAATGKDFRVPYKHIAQARIDPDLTLAGTASAPSLRGTVTIEESKIDLTRLKEQGPAEIQVVHGESKKGGLITIPEKEGARSAFIDPLSADVAVKIPKDAWLKGEGVNAELRGQVNLKKGPGKSFILLGSLSTVRGTYEFQGKVFKVTEGTVQFMGLEEPDPKLDIQAQTKIRQVTIIVTLTGSAKNLKLTLGSDPQMDQTDIVSYLVFGKPASSLDSKQALNAEGAALSLGGQIAASQLKKILGKALSLDMVTINPGGETPGEGSISVGKYVTDDVFVTYNQGFSANQPPSLDVTYEFNQNFSVETQLGDEKTRGVDFIFQFDFGD